MASEVREKLWHQLTVDVLEFCTGAEQAAAASSGKPGGAADAQVLLDLYDKVVLKVAPKLNPLSLSRIAASVASSLAHSDRTAAKALLENLLDDTEARRVQQQQSASMAASPIGGGGGYTQETATRFQLASIYLRSHHSLLLLQPLVQDPSADCDKDGALLSGVRSTIRKNAAILTQDLDVGEGGSAGGGDKTEQALVRAAHYRQAMTYHKVVGPPEAFYEQAMLYLNYAGDGTLSATSAGTTGTANENLQLAVDLCLAALTGDGVYHLQRVVQRQSGLLTLLESSPTHAWLAHMFRAVADGKVDELRQLAERHGTEIEQQPALRHRFTAVQEKVTLLALVAFVSDKPSHERCLEFDEIARAISVTADQVEWVVMRALAVGLLQGSIDQVDAKVDVTWVMPRVLNQEQLSDLASKFGSWAVKVGQTKEYMHEQTPMTFA